MPHLRGMTVHVTYSDGKSIPEFGTQYLRQQTGTKRVSTYIQSTTDVSFQVSLQPDIPFIGHLSPSEISETERVLTGQSQTRLTTGSEDLFADWNYKNLSNNTLSLPSTTPQSHPAPDFTFLASLFLDGRTKPERKIIVYTNPDDDDFKSPDGKVAFKHRWVQSADGRMTEHAWVFKEKPIETVFDKLMIAGSQGNREEDDEALIKAMESSRFDAQETMEKESKVGQIVVEIRRVILGEKRTSSDYRSHHKEGQNEDIDMEEIQRGVTHATGFVHKKTLASQPLQVVDYWPYEPDEGLYATFQFFYRSREQLQRFQFPGFTPIPTTTTARTTRFLNTRMANLTPLSISLPLDQKAKNRKPDQDSYEAKINKQGFTPDNNHKHDFGSEYRDIRAVLPSALDKVHNGKKPLQHPPAPLPFLNNQPFENTKTDPLPSRVSLAPVKASFLAGQLVASDLKVLMANIMDKDGYRSIPEDSHSSDQEDNADDERETGSDLENHAGDDGLCSAASPEEEDDGGYDSMRSRFKNVRICKRQRDVSDEDVVDDIEASHGADPAHLDGDGEQETLKLPLTEEERAGRGKKLRRASTTSAAHGGQDAYGT